MKNEESNSLNIRIIQAELSSVSHSSLFVLHSSLVTWQSVKKESTTKSFVLRIDADTMNAIEAWAADEFRSTNGQLQWIIAEALRKSGRLKKINKKKKEEECHETE